MQRPDRSLSVSTKPDVDHPVAEEVPFVLPIPLVEPVPTVLPIDRDLPTVANTMMASEDAIRPRLRARAGFLGALRSIAWGIASAAEWCFGVASLLGFLSVLAALPILQFLSLGYLLEASGRVARTGRLRDGFIGVQLAARAGGLVLGTWLMILPLRLVSSLWLSAQLIEPDGATANGWNLALTLLTVLMLLHIGMAWACGGKLRHFLFPFANPILVGLRVLRGGFLSDARDAVADFVTALRLPYYFWLGWRGFWGAFFWLAGPITLLAIGRKIPILGFVGALTLVLVLLYVPFLQLHFVVQNRFRAFLELGTVRQHFRRAPLAFGFAFFITLLFAVPLYLLKIEIIPREAAWLPSLVFIVFILPARLLTGWAYNRALRRATPRNWFFRWSARLAMLAVTLVYVLIVYFSQFLAWEGIGSLYEQHAFLLPVPFLGM